jgi:hypothetical protein
MSGTTIDRLERELRRPCNADILDDAVLGCLTDATAMDFLDGQGLDWTTENRRALSVAIDRALAEGF